MNNRGLHLLGNILKYSVVLFVIQEKIKALQAELQAVTKSKTMLEKELQEVITLTSTELEEYQEKVLELEDEVNNDPFVSVCVTVFSIFSFYDTDHRPV